MCIRDSAYTIKKFGVVNRYDLSKEFPALTLRRTAFKSAIDEVLWIWQRKSNNIHELHSHIWDEWADADGSIGKAYGLSLIHISIWHKFVLEQTSYRQCGQGSSRCLPAERKSFPDEL